MPPSRLSDHLLYHVMSPFEEIPIDRVWPLWARSRPLVVTLYDLIPFIYSHRYLARPSLRRFYRLRAELVRSADAVLAISAATATDAINLLGLDPLRVSTIYAGCSDLFQPSRAPEAQVLGRARRSLPSIRPRFLLYVGGVDFRKNVEGLIAAYARLPATLRVAHQLVICCFIDPVEEGPLRERVRQLGVEDQVVFTGYVPDDLLLCLYQACRLFVFPSHYEGFGLPMLEALSCDAAVVASRAPAVSELLPLPEAGFDPASTPEMTQVIRRGLEDEPFNAALRAAAGAVAKRFTWRRVAELTVAGYRGVLDRRSLARILLSRAG